MKGSCRFKIVQPPMVVEELRICKSSRKVRLGSNMYVLLFGFGSHEPAAQVRPTIHAQFFAAQALLNCSDWNTYLNAVGYPLLAWG